ncbi:MAG: TRAP transporter small permease [Halomonas sp.]|nr:TRAP transporter small permease [Gammaproteobacteria bacterium]NQY72863.1 TRAP transporter small permease [Halomonas sp.]
MGGATPRPSRGNKENAVSGLKRFWQGLCALLLVGIVVVPLSQVVMRDIFLSPLVGAEELTRFLLVCLVFASYPLVVGHGENIGMSELRDMLTGRPRRLLDTTIFVASAVASGVVAFATITTIADNLNNATPTLKIPFWIFLGSTAIGFAVAALQHVIRLRGQSATASHDDPPEVS